MQIRCHASALASANTAHRNSQYASCAGLPVPKQLLHLSVLELQRFQIERSFDSCFSRSEDKGIANCLSVPIVFIFYLYNTTEFIALASTSGDMHDNISITIARGFYRIYELIGLVFTLAHPSQSNRNSVFAEDSSCMTNTPSASLEYAVRMHATPRCS